MVPRNLALALLLAAALAPAARGQGGDPEKEIRALPGFVDSGQLGVDLDPDKLTVEVTLQGPLIQFVAEAARGSEPELADALAKVRSFRFRLYRLDPGEVAAARRRAQQAASALLARGWQQVVRIREADNDSFLHLKMDGKRIVGLAVVFVDADHQLGFINLAGEIDPAQIGRIGRRFDIQMLEDAQREIQHPPAEEPPP
jgi:Domain of unknown function (DUF4252)